MFIELNATVTAADKANDFSDFACTGTRLEANYQLIPIFLSIKLKPAPNGQFLLELLVKICCNCCLFIFLNNYNIQILFGLQIYIKNQERL